MCLIIIAVSSFFPNVVHAALQMVSVVILPFEVHAKEELSYLQTEIPGVLANLLKQEGARVLVLDPKSVPLWKERIGSIAAIRKIGQQNGADFVVWGSLTLIDQAYSLDARILETYGQSPPTALFLEGQGIENLPATVKDLSADIGNRLFKRAQVAEVRITGNQRIEKDAIRRNIKTAPGDIYLAKSIS